MVPLFAFLLMSTLHISLGFQSSVTLGAPTIAARTQSFYLTRFGCYRMPSGYHRRSSRSNDVRHHYTLNSRTLITLALAEGDMEDDDRPVYKSNFQARILKSKAQSQKQKKSKKSKQLKNDESASVEESDEDQLSFCVEDSDVPVDSETPQPEDQPLSGNDVTEIAQPEERDSFLEDTIEMLQSYSDTPFFLDTQQAEEYSIDSFLRGEYDRPFAEEAPAPYPKLTPSQTIQSALESLRDLDDPEPSHGAAVFLRFCAPLSRNDRWGGSVAGTGRRKENVDNTTHGSVQWKEILRGALNPTMLARRIRASNDFSILLDWNRLDVTDGMSVPPSSTGGGYDMLGVGSTVAFVNAALYFGNGIEPSIVQFTLRKINSVWLIDDAVVSRKEWFLALDSTDEDNDSLDNGEPNEVEDSKE